jgi:hypothetical protein
MAPDDAHHKPFCTKLSQAHESCIEFVDRPRMRDPHLQTSAGAAV